MTGRGPGRAVAFPGRCPILAFRAADGPLPDPCQETPDLTDLYDVYRFRGVDDWSIRVRADRVEIRQGGRNTLAAYRAITRADCLRHDPAAEARRLTEERIAEGCLSIGKGDFPGDCLRLVRGKDPKRLDLRWVPGEPVPRSGFEQITGHLVQLLRAIGIRCELVPDAGGGVLEMTVSAGQGRWGVCLTTDNHLEDPFDTVTRAIPAWQGTLPVLLLLYLREQFPDGLTLTLDPKHRPADVAAQPRLHVTDYWLGDEIAPFDETVRIARALGLPGVPAPTPIALPPLAGEGDTPPLWF